MRTSLLLASLLLALPAAAAERVIDFSGFPLNQTPPGFRSAVTGEGKPGDWRVVVDDTSPDKRPVLAQLAQDPTDEHFPLLVLQDELFGDFTVTTRFKTVQGTAEQMAGIAFRIQN